MRFRFVAALAFAVGMVLVAAFSSHVDASIGPIPLNCNRACLGPSAPFHMNSPWPGGLSGN
jgi:hypothetical protein